MEGIASLTGNKQAMMTPVEKPMMDMKVNVTLSSVDSAVNASKKAIKTAVKPEVVAVKKLDTSQGATNKPASEVKPAAESKPAASTAATNQTKVAPQTADNKSQHLYVPKKSDAQKAAETKSAAQKSVSKIKSIESDLPKLVINN
jgi:hypothetical protein